LTVGIAVGVAADSFVVSGTVAFPKEGALRIQLVDQKQFDTLGDSPWQAVIPTEQAVGKRVRFRFEGVPAGVYAIRCYQDENDNGKLDRRLGIIPKEPYGFYRSFEAKMRGPRFDEISFRVDRSVTDIALQVD
jgi:uncharacterized protein (DUF2141 family)